jgi:hypothetical protein
MNDVRAAVDQVGTRFELPDGGLGDLSRRRDRVRARRRIATAALALAVAAGGSLFAVRTFAPSRSHTKTQVGATSPTPSVATSVAPSTSTPGVPACPTPTGDSPAPVVLSSTAAPAGSSVEVSVTFGNGELWYQLWWNAGRAMPHTFAPPPWPPTGPDIQLNPAGPGPVLRLLAVAGPSTTGECTVRSAFTVPDVEPGTYHLVWIAGGFGDTTEPSSDGAYVLRSSPLTFTVRG